MSIRRDSLPLICDSFAGGGGASTGIEMALGRSPDIAINHNAAALALHAANHPDTLHLSENIYKVDPLDHVSGEHIGLAWFSPDCKHFSKAKGGKPVERNIRDLAHIIPHWVRRVRQGGGKIDVIILENVEEFSDWGPLIETPRGLMPDETRKGETFQAWCRELRRLGGKLQKRQLRACDYGAPTIRKRLFIIIRFDGQPIVWPKPTHGKPTDPDVIAGKKLPWRTAAEIINWSLACPSIFDTSAEIMDKHGLRAVRPLANATMSRVARGVRRYVLEAERPFLINLTHGVRLEPIDAPFNTITGAHRGEKAVVAPVLSYAQQGGANRSVEDPAHTITASRKDQNSIIVPTLIGCGGRAGQSRPRGGNEPLATITAKADACLATAFLAQHNNDGRRDGGVNPGRPATEPLSTITANPQQGVVAAFVSRQFGTAVGHGVDDPSATVMPDGGGKSALVIPHLMTMRNSGKPFQGVDEPTHTITAGGAGLSFVAPFMAKYYGTGEDQSVDEPFHTVTTKPRFGHVEGELKPEPLTEAQLARARAVADFLRAHDCWDDREFVTVEIGGEVYTIVDIGMRMLAVRELFNAQGFPADYILDLEFEGKPLPKSALVSGCGNSVSPPMAAALVGANCGYLMAMREAA
ncbi:MAG: C-5 cytosine-specific DNA methylase [Mesorhizobium sp.]|uniref:DNA cytosine methyltransferase n=1 Tax=Mesorhizobium sp. TaxID=1871066 RepID=UPI000FE5EAFE|nr:DNA cytosine methyltransferase [Mesorhizobium sp.]RWE59794.1 MAG: C-5 cytosine-specific DNA methylase [Mesorhizobium sp.]